VAGIDSGQREEAGEAVALGTDIEVRAGCEATNTADRAGERAPFGLLVALGPDRLALREGLASGIKVGVE